MHYTDIYKIMSLQKQAAGYYMDSRFLRNSIAMFKRQNRLLAEQQAWEFAVERQQAAARASKSARQLLGIE